MTQVRFPRPTCWKKRSNSLRLPSDLHTSAVVCSPHLCCGMCTFMCACGHTHNWISHSKKLKRNGISPQFPSISNHVRLRPKSLLFAVCDFLWPQTPTWNAGDLTRPPQDCLSASSWWTVDTHFEVFSYNWALTVPGSKPFLLESFLPVSLLYCAVWFLGIISQISNLHQPC